MNFLPNESWAVWQLQNAAMQAANEVDAVTESIDAELRGVWWQGIDSERFHERWVSQERPWLSDGSNRLRSMVRSLGVAARSEDSRARAAAKPRP